MPASTDPTRLTPTETTARLTEIDGLIAGYENTIRITRSDLDDDSGFERRLAETQATIDKWTRVRDEMIARRENGPAMIAQAHDRIAELKEERQHLKHAAQIEKVTTLQGKMAQLMRELNVSSVEELQALMAEAGQAS